MERIPVTPQGLNRAIRFTSGPEVHQEAPASFAGWGSVLVNDKHRVAAQ